MYTAPVLLHKTVYHHTEASSHFSTSAPVLLLRKQNTGTHIVHGSKSGGVYVCRSCVTPEEQDDDGRLEQLAGVL